MLKVIVALHPYILAWPDLNNLAEFNHVLTLYIGEKLTTEVTTEVTTEATTEATTEIFNYSYWCEMQIKYI